MINCAALSVPRVCEMDPDAAMSINVPTGLVKWLSSFVESSLLIHLSTDQGWSFVCAFLPMICETLLGIAISFVEIWNCWDYFAVLHV